MIIRRIIRNETLTLPQVVEQLNLSQTSIAGQTVSSETSRNIHTAYRCINILSDDVAKMPFQTFISMAPGKIERMRPDNRTQNIAWNLEVQPNRWMTPFIFKKALIMWLLTYGAVYIWQPLRRPGQRRELFILRPNITQPVFDKQGSLYYQIFWPGAEPDFIPDVEVMPILLNSVDGFSYRSVISYAKETIGKQLGAHETQSKFYGQGLNPGGILWMSGELNKDARTKVRESFEESLAGSSNAYRLAILDQKAIKFEQITMKPTDAQFLESIQQSDLEIANFFGMPLFKLNMGKQAYNSNEQANLDYLGTTLDPYLVQLEQAAALKLLTESEQNYTYFRFNRDSLLRTDAKTRAEVQEKRIFSGVATPNETRQQEDLPGYEGGDEHYIPANMTKVGAIQNVPAQ